MRLTRAPAWALVLLVCGTGDEVRAGRLAGGYNHSLIVDDLGVVWGVGRNGKQLGDNTGPDRSLPAPAPNLPPLQAVATGANFSLFLTTDGTVWCAGGTIRECGPLGGGPVQPNVAFTGASAVAGALYHVVALRPDGTVWSWGTHANTLGDGVTTTSSTPVQVQGLAGVIAVATSWYHSLAVTSDGRVWAWGANSYGQLGDGTTTARSTPVLVPGIDNVVAVATARFHSLALRADGSVWAWGDNVCGKLGDGTAVARLTPTPTLGPGTVTQIAAGEVWAWGANTYGQLGDGTTTCRLLPQRVQALSGVVDIAAAQAHALALTATGEVWTWGNNAFGQLGDGTKVQRRWPVQISLPAFAWKTGTPEITPRGGSFNTATDVSLTCATPAATIRYTLDGSEPDASSSSMASGGVLALAQSATLRVRAWSAGRPPSNLDQAAFAFNFGTLAAPTFDRPSGAYVAPLDVSIAGPPSATLRYTLDGSTPSSASSAYAAPLRLTAGATLRARAEAPDWNPSPVTSATYALQAPPPVFDPGGGSFVNDVTVTLRAPPLDWLGLHYSTDGTAPDTADPFALSGTTLTLGNVTTPLAAIAVGPGLAPSAVTTAVYDFAVAAPVPAPPPGLYGEPVSVGLHSASLGSAIHFTLDGSDPTEASPVFAAPLAIATSTHVKARAFRNGWPPSPVMSAHYVIRQPGDVAAGQAFSVAVDAAGSAWTWGDNAHGQLGDGSTAARPYVARVPGLTGLARVAAGRAHVLALGLDGRVWSWGGNDHGQLGDGSTLTRTAPDLVPGLAGIVAVACGARHSLAVDAAGRVWAWGDGAAGQTGLGTPASSVTPQLVEGPSDVVALAAGDAHSLALTADGRVWAWGDDSHGQLGNGAAGSSALPQAVAGLDDVISIAAGARHSLAVHAGGTMSAWGDDGAGQLGRGDATPTDVPGNVWATVCTPDGCAGSVLLADVADAAAGAWHSLARRGDGSLWGWGDNTRGALLDHTGAPLARPLSAPPDTRLVAAGEAHTLAVTTAGEVHAWGANEAGQVGDGGHDDVVEAQSLALAAFAWRTAPVVFSAGSGVYTEEQQVTLASAMPAADVRYTLDGSPPTQASPPVPPGGLALTEAATLRAAAWAPGYAGSVVRGADYRFLVGTPALDPPGGEYGTPQTVHALVETPQAQIVYTLDDTQPSASSPAFPPNGLRLERGATLRVQARRPGWINGEHGATYAFRVAAPTFSPTPGELPAPTAVSLSSATLGAVVRVTEDGSVPGFASPLVTGPRSVARATTLSARAFKAGWLPSATASATYTLAPGVVPAPRIQPPGGRFASAPTVTLACDEPGLTLHVTLTGVDPTPADPALPCGATIALAGSVSVKVRAWRGADGSAIARADFAITGAVATGRAHSLALRADGSVWAWGDNSHGQLGLGHDEDSETPQLVPGVADVVAIAAGDDHSLALARDGSVWAWGDNARGQLGDGTVTPRSTPVPVPVSGILALAAGAEHSLALHSDGTLIAWGRDEGAFGAGSSTPGSLTPVPAAMGLTQVAEVAAGDGFSLAVDRDGAVWAWGRNASGELGNGSNTPVAVPSAALGLAGVTQVAAGQGFALALRSDGAGRSDSWSWGAFPFGGTRPHAGLTDVTALDAGASHALALRAGGRVWAWGAGEDGQLGDGGMSSVDAPQLVPGIADLVAVAGGERHTLALHADGSVWAWGANADGQLGDGSNARRATPARVPGFALASNAWLAADPDADGLSTAAELQLGGDPLDPDTNGDGLRDGDAAALGLSLTDPDMDADGLSNRDEIALGTDPFDPDSDGDGVRDGLDAFPLDPGRWEPPPSDPGDHTPPSITLLQPSGAVLLSSTP